MKDKELQAISFNTFNMLINHELPMIRYFQTSLARYLILLKILECYFAKQGIRQETLVMSIPPHISSRSNSINILKNITERNYITKEKNKNDSRAITIMPSNVLVKEFEQWIEMAHNTKYF